MNATRRLTAREMAALGRSGAAAARALMLSRRAHILALAALDAILAGRWVRWAVLYLAGWALAKLAGFCLGRATQVGEGIG